MTRQFPLFFSFSSDASGFRFFARSFWLAMMIGFGSIACTEPPRLAAEEISPAAADEAYVNLIKRARGFDLSLVRTVQLLIAGERMDVTTLVPTVLAERGSGIKDPRSFIAFTADKSKLVFLTRLEKGKKAWRMRFPWSELKAGIRFDIPLLNKDGSSRKVEIEILRVVKGPSEKD